MNASASAGSPGTRWKTPAGYISTALALLFWLTAASAAPEVGTVIGMPLIDVPTPSGTQVYQAQLKVVSVAPLTVELLSVGAADPNAEGTHATCCGDGPLSVSAPEFRLPEGGEIKSFHVDLVAVPGSEPMRFTVDNRTLNVETRANVSTAHSGMYQNQSHTLTLPAVQVGANRFDAQLALVAANPITFELLDTIPSAATGSDSAALFDPSAATVYAPHVYVDTTTPPLSLRVAFSLVPGSSPLRFEVSGMTRLPYFSGISGWWTNGPDSVLITWNNTPLAPPQIQNYEIYLGGTADFTPGADTLYARVGDVNSHTISGLTPGQTYYALVLAVDNTGKTSMERDYLAFIPTPITIADAGGGEVYLDTAQLRLFPRALTDSVEFSEEIVTIYPAYAGLLGQPVNIGPQGIDFNNAVELALPYDPAGLPDGVEESDLLLAELVNGVWVALPGSRVDTVNHKVMALVSGTGIFAVVIPGHAGLNMPPRIAAIEVSQNVLAPDTGTPVSFTWTYANTPVPEASCKLYPKNQPELATAVSSGSPQTISIAENTVYKLECANSAGSHSGERLLRVVRVPELAAFRISPAIIAADNNVPVMFTWKYTQQPLVESTCGIDGIGAVNNGDVKSINISTLNPVVQYTLTCTNPAGSTSKAFSVFGVTMGSVSMPVDAAGAVISPPLGTLPDIPGIPGVPGEITGVVTPSLDGDLASVFSNMQLEIPAGALDQSVTITMQPDLNFTPSPDLITMPFELLPDGLSFAQEVILKIPYAQTVVDALGIDPANMAVTTFQDGRWHTLPSDVADGFISSRLTHFSTYASENGQPRLESGEVMAAGDKFEDTDINRKLVMQDDGNLVRTANAYSPLALWSSRTNGNPDAELVMQNGKQTSVNTVNDGNLVVYSKDGKALWASGTNGNPDAELIMQDDGNLVILGTAERTPLWASDTSDNPGADYLVQSDGTLVVYSKPDKAVWATNTAGNPGAYYKFQSDGNLVVYSQDGKALWASNTWGNPGAKMVMQDDGNLIIYSAPRKAVWASNTNNNPDAYYRFQDNGNLVVYSKNDEVLWSSETDGNPGAELVMQDDGNLVILSENEDLIWKSDTSGHPFAELVMQNGKQTSVNTVNDGNFVIYAREILWQSKSGGHPGKAELRMQSDGNLVIYAPEILWQSTAMDTFPYPIWWENVQWRSGQSGSPDPEVVIMNDGDMVVFGKGVRTPLWATGTNGNPGAELVMQNGKQTSVNTVNDGNLVVYSKDGEALWASNTAGNPDAELFMQGDGNLVIYGSDGSELWSSGTGGNPGAELVMQNGKQTSVNTVNDGNLVIYSAYQKRPLWHSDTGKSLQNPQGNPGAELVMQDDGNLVLYADKRNVLWSSGTGGNAGAELVMQNGKQTSVNSVNDGNLVIYSKPKQNVLWATNTDGNPSAELRMQTDGNLVLYSAERRKILWASNTEGNPGAELKMRDDGNLVIFSAEGYPLWASHTQGNEGAYYRMQNDGNLVVYSKDGKALWASDTWNNPGAELVMQDDGNLVILAPAARDVLWSTGTKNNPGAYFELRDDGGMAVMSKDGTKVLWEHRSDLDFWMARYGSYQLNQLVIPGTHDTGTYDLDDTEWVDDGNIDEKYFKADSFLHAKIETKVKWCRKCPLGVCIDYPCGLQVRLVRHAKTMHRWAQTQGRSITQQLNDGIRYFDLRVLRDSSYFSRLSANDDSSAAYCMKFPFNNQYWCMYEVRNLYLIHGLRGPKLFPVLDDIKRFLDANPKEVVILDFVHFYRMNDEDDISLKNKLKETFGDLLVPSNDGGIGLDSTLKTLWEQGKQVVVLYADSGNVNDPPMFGRTESNIRSEWPNKQEPDDLVEFLRSEADSVQYSGKYGGIKGLWVLQGQLTADLETIVKGELYGLTGLPPEWSKVLETYTSLKYMAKDANPRVTDLIENEAYDHGRRFNIVLADWYEQAGNLVDTALYLNSYQRDWDADGNGISNWDEADEADKETDLAKDSTEPSVCVYQDGNYGGWGKCYTTDQPSFGSLGINDAVSSIRVFNGAIAVLYSDANYSGTNQPYKADASQLSSNDTASSLDIIDSAREPYICVYQDANYGGWEKCYTTDQPSFGSLGINDAVSSIKVFNGAVAVLYSDANYSGTSRTYEAHTSSLSSNDTASSLDIQ